MTYRLANMADSEVVDLVDTDAYQATEQLSSEDCINLIDAECKGDPCLLKEIVDNLEFPLYKDFEDILNLLVKVTATHFNQLSGCYDPDSKDKFYIKEFVLADFEKLAMNTLKFLKETGYFSDEVLEERVDEALANPFLN